MGWDGVEWGGMGWDGVGWGGHGRGGEALTASSRRSSSASSSQSTRRCQSASESLTSPAAISRGVRSRGIDRALGAELQLRTSAVLHAPATSDPTNEAADADVDAPPALAAVAERLRGGRPSKRAMLGCGLISASNRSRCGVALLPPLKAPPLHAPRATPPSIDRAFALPRPINAAALLGRVRARAAVGPKACTNCSSACGVARRLAGCRVRSCVGVEPRLVGLSTACSAGAGAGGGGGLRCA